MSFSSLLGLPAGLQVLSFDLVNNVLLIQVASTACESACPVCQGQTSRIHSQYTRKAADVACGGRQVQLILHVRKFFCLNRDCPRKITTRAAHSFSGTMGTCDHPTESGNRSHWLGHLRTLGFSLGFSSQYWDRASEHLATSHEACHQDDRQAVASGCGRLLVPAWQDLWHGTGGSATAPDP